MSALPVDPHLYSTFLGVMAVMAITPGPANLFAVATGVEKGRASALIGVVGMNAPPWSGSPPRPSVWAPWSRPFPTPFKVIAVGGALYVAWLGIKALRGAFATAADPAPDHAVAVRKGRSAFVDGFAVQIANPKAILFFTAVLPPFWTSSGPSRRSWPCSPWPSSAWI
jgi:threonine/homoserine/homoserine lactone efflux protein